MTRLFYEKHVPADPLLAPLFATVSPDHPHRLAAWLAEAVGGTPAYSDRYRDYAHMLAQYRDKALTEEQRSRWVELLLQSASEAGLPDDPEFRSAFTSYLEWESRVAIERSRQEKSVPEVPMPRWNWNTGAGPPASASTEPADVGTDVAPTPVLPAADRPIRFQEHIKTLFRPRDRQSMQFAFDLWSYDDVSAHADDILDRVRAGTMPCDGAWPKEQVAAFERWVDEGKPK